MNMLPVTTVLILLVPGPYLLAQDYLFTTTLPEETASGSGGTFLRHIHPNEIAHLSALPCPNSAEKWAPRTMFHTQAGDEDGDDSYWEPSLFSKIDALVATWANNPLGLSNQRTVYYSVAAPMGTMVSGPPGLRPGDVARIARIGTSDGMVDYFFRAEDVQASLGLPPTPLIVDVDACASDQNLGVFFSIESDQVCPLCTSGTTLVRDGDVLFVPSGAISWTTAGTVGSVAPGSAVVLHSEAQMDAFVTNAGIANHLGVCVQQIVDVDALDIDWSGAMAGAVPTCFGAAPFPHLVFAGESLTGGALLDTQSGGRIHPGVCAPYGTNCGVGVTTGLQIGLRPPTVAQGISSSVNGLASPRVFRFVSEAEVPQIAVNTAASIDFASPSALTWVFLAFAPSGPAMVPSSLPFPPAIFCYPDYYAPPFFMGWINTGTGFGTYTSPPIPFPVDLIWMGVGIVNGNIEISTPSMVEVF
ncbi:MAG: hypothetical protein Fur0037_03130 [Planctomycetota bacterium]